MGKRKTVANAEGVNADGAIHAAWALRLPDGQALMRADIQFDLLSFIFGNAHYRFTPPQYTTAASSLFPVERQWTFAELYLDCLANSPKASRTLREKMAESQDFAVGFAKIGMLCNTGRLNTTMALNKELKTSMRTYHPIPSIQLDEFTRKNIPDAPRMKAQVKGCLLSSELPSSPPEGLRAIAERAAQGVRPSTTSANLIFWLFAQSEEITARYMPEGYDFNKLFYSMKDVRSNQRAECFLAILHRFLETPYCLDDLNAPSGTKIDLGIHLQRQAEPLAHENQDSPEELAWAEQQRHERAEFVAGLQDEEKLKHTTSLQGASVPPVDKPPRSRSRVKKDPSETPVAAPPNGAISELMMMTAIADPSTLPAGHALLQDLHAVAPPFDKYWHDVLDKDPHYSQSLLSVAWSRLVSDIDSLRDPLYDSDNEDLPPYNRPALTARELRPRLSPGFIVRAPHGGLARTRYLRPMRQSHGDKKGASSTPV